LHPRFGGAEKIDSNPSVFDTKQNISKHQSFLSNQAIDFWNPGKNTHDIEPLLGVHCTADRWMR